MIAEIMTHLIGILGQGSVEDAFEVDGLRSRRHGDSRDMSRCCEWKVEGDGDSSS